MNEQDYTEVLADHDRLVRELDVLLNGKAGAARQAKLVDIISQVRARREVAIELANKLDALGVTDKRWPKSSHSYFSHTGGRVSLGDVDDFFNEVVSLAERTAKFLRPKQ